MKELKGTLVLLGAVAVLAYMLFQALMTALQPLFVALAGKWPF